MRFLPILVISFFGYGCSAPLPVPATHPDYVNYLEQEAERESARAQYELGLLHIFGRDSHNPSSVLAEHGAATTFTSTAHSPEPTTRNREQGLALIEQAAEGGYASAQVLMGILYGFSEEFSSELENPVYRTLSIEKDITLAQKWLAKAAESGDADGIYWHSRLAYLGEIELDIEKAILQLEISANKGHTLSQTFLAHIYNDEIWVPADLEKSFKLLERAAQNGDVTAQNSLGIFYMTGVGVEASQAEGFRWFKKAANNGLAMAQFNLGTCYEQGIGIEADFSEALIWYQLSAAKKHLDAINRLATLYMHGTVVPQDASEAATWFQTAADLGDAEAQTNLGYLYSEGNGVNKNARAAVKLYRDAALQGYLPAVHNLGLAYLQGFGVAQSDETALKLLTTSAQSGYEHSQFLLGKVLLEGQEAGSQQYQYGLYWISQAAKSGHNEALEYMVSHGLEEEILKKPLPAQAHKDLNAGAHL